MAVREVTPGLDHDLDVWDYGSGIVLQRTRSDPKSQWRLFVRGQAATSRGMASVTVMQSCASAKLRSVVDLGLIDDHTG